ncbi:MAG: hypothetical protein LBH13_01690 [Cellulomonadaceae bacterium]|nr:hypothetical protein [Cellulomonadaceae bacterium]
MARARQESEEYDRQWEACLSEFGVESVTMVGGGVAMNIATDDDGNQLPGQEELVHVASEACEDRIERPASLDGTNTPEAYAKTLEVRACVIAHGFELPEPPSQEVWIEHDESAWNPFTVLMDPTITPTDQQPTREQLEELTVTCPQAPGPRYGIMYD